MINIKLILAILLTSTVALAAPAFDAPAPELAEGLRSSWGDWPIFVGVAVALFVRGWQVWRPLALDALPSRLRPLVAVVFAGLPAVSIALLDGEDWLGAAIALLQAFAGAAGTIEALRLAFGKPTTREQ
jgi:hypothetical protein